MDYETGFARLQVLLELHSPERRAEAEMLEARYQNCQEEQQRFGLTEMVRSLHAQIDLSLNQLALAACGVSFNDLCVSPTTPGAGALFISHALPESAGAATRLYKALSSAGQSAWLDVQCCCPEPALEDQVEEALAACQAVLLLLTPRSRAEGSLCEPQWRRALQYKRPIILLRPQPNTPPPDYLKERKLIELNAGLPKVIQELRQHLDWLHTPEGSRYSLEERLADARCDLPNASPAEAPRIQAEIAELEAQIAELKPVIAHPQQAAQDTERRIQSGLQRQQQPTQPTGGKGRKFINPPPAEVPSYFQDRQVETGLLGDFLQQPGLRLVTIIGRAGIGKTTLALKLLKALENGRLPALGNAAEGQPFEVNGIVYLSAVGLHPINLGELFSGLCKLLPAESATRLDEIYRQPQIDPGSKMLALLEAFPTGRVIVLLDNFENLVNAETSAIADSELDAALRALLQASQHAVQVLITTRLAARELALVEPGRQQRLELDHGLASPHAENLLRAMDVQGTVGLKTAPDEMLAKARERTGGYPRALEALYGILSADRFTTLEEALAAPLPENVVAALVGQAYERLDATAKQVMQALALYNHPVPPTAVDYLLQPYLPEVNSTRTLNRLVSMHFARKESGRYYLHPMDREYALAQTPPGQEVDRQSLERGARPIWTQYALRNRAAEYFYQARKPREEWKSLADLEAQLAEFDLRCAGGEWDAAARVLLEIDFSYLLRWGHWRLMAEMHTRLQGKLQDAELKGASAGNLGQVYENLGQAQQAITLYNQALAAARELQNRQAEGVWLGNLGNVFASMGDTLQAIKNHELALEIARQVGDRQGESANLGNLGNRYAELGDTSRAIQYYQQALEVETDDRSGRSIQLGNLANRYADLGEIHRAIDYYGQALATSRQDKDKRNEGVQLGNLGNAWAALGNLTQAIDYSKQALEIARQIGDQRGEGANLGNLGLAYAALGDFPRAIQLYQQAEEIGRQIDFPYIEASCLHYRAQVLLNLGNISEAAQLAEEAMFIAAETHLAEATQEGGATLALARLAMSDLPAARQAILAASQVDLPFARHIVLRLLGIIALRQGDSAAARQAFAEALKQAGALLALTPELYQALDTKALALCGLALLEDTPAPEAALEALQEARRVTKNAAGITLGIRRLLEALADPHGRLAEARRILEASAAAQDAPSN